jgi:threonine/homoserine/homoserine lactone efflux protein
MEQFTLVVGIVWLAVISPGADFAMVSRISFLQGRQAGIMAAIGIATACWFHVFYATFGLGIIQRIFPHFLDVLKVFGAGYLIYSGIKIALSHPVPGALAVQQTPAGSGVRALATGILTNGLNPKTAIFVVSIYAQIIGPSTPLEYQLGYGAIISLSHLLWFTVVALFLSQAEIRAQVLARQRTANGIIGGALMILGMTLAMLDLPQNIAA